MRILFIIVTLLGLLILLSILDLGKAIEVNSALDLDKLTQNQKVKFSGKVIDQESSKDFLILKLDTNLTLTYSGEKSNFLNKNISGTGIYDEFIYKKIKTLKIKILE